MLIFCAPTAPLTLWTEFRQHICDDLRPRVIEFGLVSPTEEDICDYGLFLLQGILAQSGRTLRNFSLPEPQRNWQQQSANRFIAEQLHYDTHEQQASAEERQQLLNTEQAHAFERIVHAVTSDSPKTFFLSGYGGTGKTFLYQTLCNHLRGQGRIVLCVAASGIASLLLPGGRTAHSMFKIPIDGLTAESICGIPKESALADMIRMAAVVI
ncbi:PIF1-like helicase-domain-containing protein, partial [Irpex lacteus]